MNFYNISCKIIICCKEIEWNNLKLHLADIDQSFSMYILIAWILDFCVIYVSF